VALLELESLLLQRLLQRLRKNSFKHPRTTTIMAIAAIMVTGDALDVDF
jgi:hypothetical protein